MLQNTLKIIEIFRSLQGESLLAGLPCMFIRLAGCNLDCRWCDTSYAAKGDGAETGISQITRSVKDHGDSAVCITGGEPLLQPGTSRLAEQLLAMGLTVSVETNGSRDISVLPRGVIRVMDIKCPSSRQCGSTLSSNLPHLGMKDNIKFVIADSTDFSWAVNFVEKYELTQKSAVLFSPVILPEKGQQTRNPDILISKARQLAEWILDSGLQVRLQIQLHKMLWPECHRGK